MKYCDAHCHLANLADKMDLTLLIPEATEKGITAWLSSALRKCEVSLYSTLAHPAISFSAGIHPNFDECDLTLDDIIALCKSNSIWAIGEIGLDNNNPEYAVMLDLFTKQLDIAMDYRLPVVLHIVGHQQQAFEILKQYPLKYLVHGYAGSIEGYKLFARLNSYFTISHRILREDKSELLKAMLNDKRFLFETDITQYYVTEGESNPLLRLNAVIEEVASQSKLSIELLQHIQKINYKKLTGKDL